jgi:hypothetical protein
MQGRLFRVELIVRTQSRQDVLTQLLEGGQTNNVVHGWRDDLDKVGKLSPLSIGHRRRPAYPVTVFSVAS